jgi:hypothetical protein
MSADVVELADFKARLLAAARASLVVEPVSVPELGSELEGTLFVKALRGEEREKYFESIRRIVGKGKNKDVEILTVGASRKLAAMTVCDKDGNSLAGDWLQELSAKGLARIVDAAGKLNGLGDEAEDDAKNVSSATTPTADVAVASTP